jgi:hypothetical protein
MMKLKWTHMCVCVCVTNLVFLLHSSFGPAANQPWILGNKKARVSAGW